MSGQAGAPKVRIPPGSLNLRAGRQFTRTSPGRFLHCVKIASAARWHGLRYRACANIATAATRVIHCNPGNQSSECEMMYALTLATYPYRCSPSTHSPWHVYVAAHVARFTTRVRVATQQPFQHSRQGAFRPLRVAPTLPMYGGFCSVGREATQRCALDDARPHRRPGYGPALFRLRGELTWQAWYMEWAV